MKNVLFVVLFSLYQFANAATHCTDSIEKIIGQTVADAHPYDFKKVSDSGALVLLDLRYRASVGDHGFMDFDRKVFSPVKLNAYTTFLGASADLSSYAHYENGGTVHVVETKTGKTQTFYLNPKSGNRCAVVPTAHFSKDGSKITFHCELYGGGGSYDTYIATYSLISGKLISDLQMTEPDTTNYHETLRFLDSDEILVNRAFSGGRHGISFSIYSPAKGTNSPLKEVEIPVSTKPYRIVGADRSIAFLEPGYFSYPTQPDDDLWVIDLSGKRAPLALKEHRLIASNKTIFVASKRERGAFKGFYVYSKASLQLIGKISNADLPAAAVFDAQNPNLLRYMTVRHELCEIGL